MPTTTKNIELLAYSPKKMDEFIKFCIEGKRNAMGEYETDPEGSEIVGVFNWLYSREVLEAHFFNTAPGTVPQLFFAMVQRKEEEEEPVPWIGKIPGFIDMIQFDGLIGEAADFKKIEDLLALVKPNLELDAEFKKRQIVVARLLESLKQQEGSASMEKEDFLKALRGESGSKQALFAEVTKAFSKSA